MTQGIEAGPRTPESVAEKPKSVLKQVMEVLKPRTEGENADLILAGVKDPMYWAEIYLSPRQPIFNTDALNKFTDTLLEQLKTVIKNHDAHFDKVGLAKKLDKKGGIIFPYISYGSEIIGKQITTTHFSMSDTLYYNEGGPKEKEIKRSSTAILIYPNSQVAEFASVARGQSYRLPGGFNSEIIWSITEKQIKDLARVTLKPSNPAIDNDRGF